MNEFNIVITGIGGQGSVTLADVIEEAALKQGYDVKGSELHGLAQRGGTIPCHVRFGDKIYSPLIREGKANLIVGLEELETLRACNYGSKDSKTVFVLDSCRIIPLSVNLLGEKYPSQEEIVRMIESFSSKVVILKASETLKKETGSSLATNIFLLGYLTSHDLLPIKKDFIIDGIREVVPEKYFESNMKIFEMGCQAKE